MYQNGNFDHHQIKRVLKPKNTFFLNFYLLRQGFYLDPRCPTGLYFEFNTSYRNALRENTCFCRIFTICTPGSGFNPVNIVFAFCYCLCMAKFPVINLIL